MSGAEGSGSHEPLDLKKLPIFTAQNCRSCTVCFCHNPRGHARGHECSSHSELPPERERDDDGDDCAGPRGLRALIVADAEQLPTGGLTSGADVIAWIDAKKDEIKAQLKTQLKGTIETTMTQVRRIRKYSVTPYRKTFCVCLQFRRREDWFR